jgi:Asp-tRNA(Asn)/Glu-tRNA(Gln) amidotransferase B subunit
VIKEIEDNENEQLIKANQLNEISEEEDLEKTEDEVVKKNADKIIKDVL